MRGKDAEGETDRNEIATRSDTPVATLHGASYPHVICPPPLPPPQQPLTTARLLILTGWKGERCAEEREGAPTGPSHARAR